MSENHWENQPGTPPDVIPECGQESDGERLYLWRQIVHWRSGTGGSQCNPLIELDKQNHWAVMNGGATGASGWLLVPTDRKKGIECRDIWTHRDPNYWNAAWGYVRSPYGSPTTTGLGINSKDKRTQDQLHIHIATFQSDAKTYLDARLPSEIATTPGDWAKKLLTVPSDSKPGQVYRVLHVKDLATDNLFNLLQSNVVPSDQMGNQTMIVIPAKSGGFYVLNSDISLSQGAAFGTGTCNHLLKCS
ncbi:CDP-diacylglycerol diphosphatase [Streptomyces avermitilis]|uniref:CDP-diacylglycerol diphosphatase n=1 Tax=Streptomyces avermitilis TaxID=33903 RepID=UPI0036BEF458